MPHFCHLPLTQYSCPCFCPIHMYLIPLNWKKTWIFQSCKKRSPLEKYQRQKDISTYIFSEILFPMKIYLQLSPDFELKNSGSILSPLMWIFFEGSSFFFLHGFIKWKVMLVALFQYSLLYSYSANKIMLITFLFKVLDTYYKTSLMNIFFLLKLSIPQ